MAESMRPGTFSMRDIQPAGSNNIWENIAEDLGFKSPSFDPSRKSHNEQLKVIQTGIMAGQFADEEITDFALKNPSTIPFLQQAIRQRDILKNNLQGENPSLGGAIGSAIQQGDTGFGKELAQFLPKEGSEKNITSIQLGLRAEGQKTGDPRIDSLDPKTAANVLARTTAPVAVQTVGGTALYGRGDVPGGTLPQFLPSAPTAEEARMSARGEVASSNLNKFEKLLNDKKFSPGPVSGRALRASGYTGVRLSNDEAVALSLEQGIGNDLLQAMRGAQVGPKEQEMFQKQLPRVDQPEPLFRANLERSRENLIKLNQLIEQKRRGVVPPGKPKSIKEMSNEDLFKKVLGK